MTQEIYIVCPNYEYKGDDVLNIHSRAFFDGIKAEKYAQSLKHGPHITYRVYTISVGDDDV